MNTFLLGVLIGLGLTVAANGITATYVLQTIAPTITGTVASGATTTPEMRVQLDLVTKEQAQFVATIISIILIIISFILQPLSKKIHTPCMSSTVETFHGAAWSFVLIHLVMTGLGYEPLSALLGDIRPVI